MLWKSAKILQHQIIPELYYYDFYPILDHFQQKNNIAMRNSITNVVYN